MCIASLLRAALETTSAKVAVHGAYSDGPRGSVSMLSAADWRDGMSSMSNKRHNDTHSPDISKWMTVDDARVRPRLATYPGKGGLSGTTLEARMDSMHGLVTNNKRIE